MHVRPEIFFFPFLLVNDNTKNLYETSRSTNVVHFPDTTPGHKLKYERLLRTTQFKL